ncbi:transglutaminase domain-containing protein [Evansella sp. AB-rgal1]|uniref:transglutaminase domain-containing protein n=1 Tax=Evansella sp. AB-rgal1 TaxID=3242696 RepID=UPI00359E0808
MEDLNATDELVIEESESEQVEESNAEPLHLLAYAEEVDFQLHTPDTSAFDVHTIVKVEGTVNKIKELTRSELWIIVKFENRIEDLKTNEFHYYVPVESNGSFVTDLQLHHGSGEYDVFIRVPSIDPEEDNLYYEVAKFKVTNLDEDIQREVEYTLRGLKEGVVLSEIVRGFSEAKETITIEGTVPDNYQAKVVMVNVQKDRESQHISLPIEEGRFSGEVPLYFGEGIHYIMVQTHDSEENYYYDAASFYVDNTSARDFVEVELYREFLTNEMEFFEPNLFVAKQLSDITYRVEGEIDPQMPGAEEMSHVIVTMKKTDEKDADVLYIIPVENYRFAGDVYFRFGPGNYDVTMNLLDTDREGPSVFYYRGIKKFTHHVQDIEDKRSLLPSRGIESDHPQIINKANELTKGISGEREKALAIYEFVSKHVSYDVQKWDELIFDISDSALLTLESGKGVCQDYAYLAIALFRAIGMEANYIEGYAGGRHAWVEVKVDGEWLVMDPTWGAGYVDKGEFVPDYREDYFDPEAAFFEETHRRNGIVY